MAARAHPPLLLPYQQRWVKDQSRVKVYEKSRRIGISWATACEMVMEAAEGKQDGWYIAYDERSALEYITDCGWWTRKLNVPAHAMHACTVADENLDIQAWRIRFRSGKKITALTSRPRNLRGKQGRVAIDEAAFHTEAGGLPELLKAAMALLIWGGSVEVISTHDGVDNPFNTLCEDIRAGRKDYSLHRTTFDEALAEGLYERICLVNGDEWTEQGQQAWRDSIITEYGDGADEELFCIPASSGGRFLPRPLIEAAMDPELPVLRKECPEGWALQDEATRMHDMQRWLDTAVQPALQRTNNAATHYLGMDFGRSADLSVQAPMYLAQDLTRVVPFLIELRNVPYDQQRQSLHWLMDRLPRFQHAKLDATGNGEYLGEVTQQRYGEARVEAVKLTLAWYGEHLPRFKARFEDSELRIPKDFHVLSDLEALRVEDGIPRLPKHRTGSKVVDKRGKPRHGDAAIALALAEAAAAGPVASYAYTPSRRGRFTARKGMW